MKFFALAGVGLLVSGFALTIAGCNFVNSSSESSTSTTSTFKSQSATLTISAAASLTNVMEEVRLLWQKENPENFLTFNFGSSGSLQAQIEQGAPVDIFVSAATKQMDVLQKQGLLLSSTRKNFLTNQVALIEPKNVSALKDFNDLKNGSVKRLAIADPESVPAGMYAQEVLTWLRILELVKPKLVLAKDVRQVLSYVETGNVDAGIVYLTDAKTSRKVRIVAIAPEQSHSAVSYSVAVLKDSKNVTAAQEFVQFLSSPQAKAVFQKHGFGIASN
ncbi:molybdate ABC transporter substrate-binding protein [Trichocoleus sp. FACHB-262]|uniref:molybdate ABC transporter substrate-binding protein n=1 Tax=Trichocoleus sp. FACHB-262 TaxID=2692869 RepID=UPI001687A3E7|nr:molybdate ABC transporter substrate-binding protein [Trichocoleus sp. FACHB-262]MBD2122372.1 molybdate ABC transporter substrate-binding protein [Trichocoleus sp. FACHB-262]